MKNITLTVVLLLIGALKTHGQWTAVETGINHFPYHEILGISLVNENIIWATTYNWDYTGAQYMRSTDGGQSWKSGYLLSDTSQLASLQIQGIDTRTAYASTVELVLDPVFGYYDFYSSLLKTQDGGDNWTILNLPIENPGTEQSMEFHFFDEDSGIAFVAPYFSSFRNDELKIFRTENGGEVWEEVDLEPYGGRIFWSGNNALEVIGDTVWIGTLDGTILRSADRGENWDTFDTTPLYGELKYNNINSIAFRNSKEGLAVVNRSSTFPSSPFPTTGLKTIDGGQSWFPIKLPDRIELIEYIKGSKGVYVATVGYVGAQDFFISKDGGDNWLRSQSPVFATIQFLSPEIGWAAGGVGEDRLYKYTGPPLTFDSEAKEALLWRPVNGESLPAGYVIADVSSLNENQLWAVANNNSPSEDGVDFDEKVLQVLKSSDGGVTWENRTPPFVAGVISSDIQAVDEQNIWFSTRDFGGPGLGTGRGQALYQSKDGGDTWSQKLFHDVASNWVHFFNEQEGFCTFDGEVAYTDDGGNNWTFQYLPLFGDESTFTVPRSVAVIDNTIWVGTDSGRIFKSNNKGKDWVAIDVDNCYWINSIAFKDTLNGIILTPYTSNFNCLIENVMARTSDGGLTWEPLPDIGYWFEEIVYVPGSRNSYVVTNTNGNVMAYTNDGGDTWEILPDVQSFSRLHFQDPANGWAVNLVERDSLDPVLYKWSGLPFPAETTSRSSVSASALPLNVYPNPFKEVCYIELPEKWPADPFEMAILDVSGKVVYKNIHNGNDSAPLLVNLDGRPSGVYFVRLTSADITASTRILKQ